jgi:hypothetical protein
MRDQYLKREARDYRRGPPSIPIWWSGPFQPIVRNIARP